MASNTDGKRLEKTTSERRLRRAAFVLGASMCLVMLNATGCDRQRGRQGGLSNEHEVPAAVPGKVEDAPSPNAGESATNETSKSSQEGLVAPTMEPPDTPDKGASLTTSDSISEAESSPPTHEPASTSSADDEDLDGEEILAEAKREYERGRYEGDFRLRLTMVDPLELENGDDIEREMFEEKLGEQMSALEACVSIEESSSGGKAPVGAFELHFRVDTDGRPEKVAVRSKSLSTRAEKCIATAIQSWRFPPQETEVRVRAPIKYGGALLSH